MNNKEIKITCESKHYLNPNELIEFQGTLKTLEKKQFEKIKASILKYGFSFPLFVWENNKQNYILDGHQRAFVVQQLIKEGYDLPLGIPIVKINASSRKEAKEKLLLASSQYAKITEEGMCEYINEADINIEEISDIIDLPNVDLNWSDKIEENDKEEEKEEKLESDQVICPDCGCKFKIGLKVKNKNNVARETI